MSLGLFKHAAGADVESDGVKPPDGIKGKILTATTFNLKQQRGREKRPETSLEPDELQVLMPSGEIKRPLHIQLTDVKIIMPLEVRNAVVGVYMHMLSAFTGPPRSAKEKKITDCIPPEQLQERRQEEHTEEKGGVRNARPEIRWSACRVQVDRFAAAEGFAAAR